MIHKWEDHGIRLVGFWTPLLGEKSNQLVYIWVKARTIEKIRRFLRAHRPAD